MLTQILSLSGAFLVLLAFGSLQIGWMKEESRIYGILNLAGGMLLLAASILVHQSGFILLQGAWCWITLQGMLRFSRSRKDRHV